MLRMGGGEQLSRRRIITVQVLLLVLAATVVTHRLIWGVRSLELHASNEGEKASRLQAGMAEEGPPCCIGGGQNPSECRWVYTPQYLLVDVQKCPTVGSIVLCVAFGCHILTFVLGTVEGV